MSGSLDTQIGLSSFDSTYFISICLKLADELSPSIHWLSRDHTHLRKKPAQSEILIT